VGEDKVERPVRSLRGHWQQGNPVAGNARGDGVALPPRPSIVVRPTPPSWSLADDRHLGRLSKASEVAASRSRGARP